MNNSTLFSSENMAWETRPEVFNPLNEFFKFDLDPCADSNNAKTKDFFTIEQDGLKQDWSGRRVFINPPYGRESQFWVKKAAETALRGDGVIVMLLASRTETIAFHKYLLPHAGIHYFRGRLVFGSDGYWKKLWETELLEKNGKMVKNSLFGKVGKFNPAPFPSLLAIIGEIYNQNLLQDIYKQLPIKYNYEIQRTGYYLH